MVTVRYDDGDLENLDLEREMFRVLGCCSDGGDGDGGSGNDGGIDGVLGVGGFVV